VPSLRGVIFTAPYGHDGQLATLEDVVRHYSELNLDRLHADGEQVLKPLRLTAREQKDSSHFSRPFPPMATRGGRSPGVPVSSRERPVLHAAGVFD
jgi:cytochrome c peroxidase